MISSKAAYTSIVQSYRFSLFFFHPFFSIRLMYRLYISSYIRIIKKNFFFRVLSTMISLTFVFVISASRTIEVYIMLNN